MVMTRSVPDGFKKLGHVARRNRISGLRLPILAAIAEIRHDGRNLVCASIFQRADEEEQPAELVVRADAALAIKTMDHGDVAVTDGNARPCLVLAVFEVALFHLRQGDAECLSDVQAEISKLTEGEDDVLSLPTPVLPHGLPPVRFGDGSHGDASENGINREPVFGKWGGKDLDDCRVMSGLSEGEFGDNGFAGPANRFEKLAGAERQRGGECSSASGDSWVSICLETGRGPSFRTRVRSLASGRQPER